jgi:hypothetical protein
MESYFPKKIFKKNMLFPKNKKFAIDQTDGNWVGVVKEELSGGFRFFFSSFFKVS